MKTIRILICVSIFAFALSQTSCNDDEDTTPPVITLKGNTSMAIEATTNYNEPGATAIDETDGDISSKIVITHNIDINTLGFYEVKYNVSDVAGNAATEVIRTVEVISI